MSSTTKSPILERRRAAGYSREQLAVKAGLSTSTVGWAERLGFATPATVSKLARALQCTELELQSNRPAGRARGARS